MNRIVFIIVILFICITFTNLCFASSDNSTLNTEYQNENVELCISWEQYEKNPELKERIGCVSGGSDIFSEKAFETAIDFSKRIKFAYRNNNIDIIADSITYPLYINGYKGKKEIVINSKKELLKLDKSIILNKRVLDDIDKNRLFWNWRGFMLGNGQIWFWADSKISDVTINLN